MTKRNGFWKIRQTVFEKTTTILFIYLFLGLSIYLLFRRGQWARDSGHPFNFIKKNKAKMVGCFKREIWNSLVPN